MNTPIRTTLAHVPLAGRAVRLEPLSRAHLPALREVALDPELWRITTTRIRTEDELRAYVEEALANEAAGTALPYATVEIASGRVVGSTRFANIVAEHRRAEIGWTWIARPWQRTAVNTEAKYLMLRHGFETLGWNRVELKTDAINARSRAAILRIGATEEGTLRRHMVVHDGRLRDSVYFSVISEEWPRVKAGLEEKLAR